MKKERKWKPSDDGLYHWTCNCGKTFTKTTPQGIEIAKENHNRSHRMRR